MNSSLEVSTSRRCQMIDITDMVNRHALAGGCREGICLLWCTHTTAGITVNEGADPDVAADILDRLERLAPRSGGYRHAEGNADAHIKAALIGPSVAMPVSGGRLALGTWQRVFFCEFDGPRSRSVAVTVIAEQKS